MRSNHHSGNAGQSSFRKLITGWGLIIILAVSSCNTNEPGLSEITAEEFLNKYDPETSVILDVRTRGEFAGGHLPGAKLLDVYSPGAGEELMKLDKSKTYFVYCHSGVRSRSVVTILRERGFVHAYNIRGGIISLSRSGASFDK